MCVYMCVRERLSVSVGMSMGMGVNVSVGVGVWVCAVRHQGERVLVFVCVRVCACVRVRACVCVRACVRVNEREKHTECIHRVCAKYTTLYLFHT